MACLATMRVATFALLPWMVAAQSASSTATETFTQSETPTGDFDDPYFMGYWIKSDEGTPAPYETVRITAHTPWVTSGTYAGDCDEFNDPCWLATACTTSGSALKLLSADGLSSECDSYATSEQKCHTLTIYASSPEGRPTAYNIACREEDWSMDTLFQVSPSYSSEDPEDTDSNVPNNGDGDRNYYSSGRTSTPAIIAIIIACIVGAGVLAFFIWAPLHWRKKRRLKEQESQMEISTFARNRGYTANNVAAAEAEPTESVSTIGETRNATIGETVPSTVNFGGDTGERDEGAVGARPTTAARGP